MERLYGTSVDLDEPLIVGMVDAALDCICKDEGGAILYHNNELSNRMVFDVFTDATRYEKFRRYMESRGILDHVCYDFYN